MYTFREGVRNRTLVTAQELARAGKRVAYLVRAEAPASVAERARRLSPSDALDGVEVKYGREMDETHWAALRRKVLRSRDFDAVILDVEGVLR